MPLVSVRLMTYNHEPYIAEAIEGCLMQETSFPFEIVIGDDFSTDGTTEICKEYAAKYPDKIKLLDRSIGGYYWKKRQELGRLYNFTNIIANCTGKYIALLDGDDYWSDTSKLEKQVNCLEANQGYSLCFHGSMIKTKENLYSKDFSFIEANTIQQEDLLIRTHNNFIPTATLLFNKEYLPVFPDWFFKQPLGDWTLNLLLLRDEKKGYFLSENMSVYRQEGQGIWDQLSDIKMTLKKRDYIQALLHSDLKLSDKILKDMIIKFDQLIDKFISELNSKDMTQKKTSELLKYVTLRLKKDLTNNLTVKLNK